MQHMSDTATPFMTGYKRLSESELIDIFSSSPFEFSASCQVDHYCVVFKFNVGKFEHEFTNRTYYQLIDDAEVAHSDYMSAASIGIINEVKNYSGKIMSVV